LTVRQAYTVAAVAWLRALSNAEHIDFEEAPRIFVRASSQFLFDFPVSNLSELLLQARRALFRRDITVPNRTLSASAIAFLNPAVSSVTDNGQ
jgi:hypothetical protein